MYIEILEKNFDSVSKKFEKLTVELQAVEGVNERYFKVALYGDSKAIPLYKMKFEDSYSAERKFMELTTALKNEKE